MPRSASIWRPTVRTAVTPNDAGDADSGPNALQNFPVITALVAGGNATINDGTLFGPRVLAVPAGQRAR
jgi:hypothetical protein